MVEKVISWKTGFETALREPVLILTVEGGAESVFMMPAHTAEEMGKALLVEASRAEPPTTKN